MAKKLYSINVQVRRNLSMDADMARDMARLSRHTDVNWSQVCRKAIQRKINQLDKER